MPRLTRKYPTAQKTTTPEGKRDYDRQYKKDMREQQAKAKRFPNKEKNRLGFLELEVQRLNHCLQVALASAKP